MADEFTEVNPSGMKQVWLFVFCMATTAGMAQNVGIGTASPQKKLHVVSADSIAVQIEGADLSSSTAAVGISIRPTNNVSFQWVALRGRTDAFVVNSARLYLNRKYDNDTRTVMFVDEYGRVGIGGTEADLDYEVAAKLNILQKGLAASGLFLEAPYIRDGIIIKGLTSNLYPNPAAQKISALRFQFNQFENSRLTLENLGSIVNPLLSFEMFNPTSFNHEKVMTLDRTGVIMNKTLGVNETLTVAGNTSLYQNLTVYGTISTGGDINTAGNINITGTINTGVVRPFVDVDMPTNFIAEIFCACPSGYKAIGGGGGHRDYNTAAQDIKINYSGPDPNDSGKWKVIATNTNTTQLRAVRVYAICARIE